MLDTFKMYWTTKITLVNQTAVSASLHGYGMMAANNNNSVVSYGESLANFGAAYTTTQESVKTQGTMIASMQSQLQAMQQYCMALQQQPPPRLIHATSAAAAAWLAGIIESDNRRRPRISSPGISATGGGRPKTDAALHALQAV
jgi:hypothetical protein